MALIARSTTANPPPTKKRRMVPTADELLLGPSLVPGPLLGAGATEISKFQGRRLSKKGPYLVHSLFANPLETLSIPLNK